MGFAVVDVSMRGTGCSGGAFDFFEPLQSLDGYDAIETIARQDWVRGHKVGLMGISYGGISQLFTAATRPPSLSAISPLSVLDAVPKRDPMAREAQVGSVVVGRDEDPRRHSATAQLGEHEALFRSELDLALERLLHHGQAYSGCTSNLPRSQMRRMG